MPQECCSTERKTITTGFCVALTANHEQFFLSGCPSLLSGSAVNPDVRDEAISLWSWQPRGRLLPQQVPSQEAHCLKPEAGWLQNWVISRSVLPATDQKLAETCSANRLRKHHQRSSSLQDTEWVSARNADKSSPIFLESWQRHTFCSSKNCAGWNVPMSLSKKRSWLVSPDQQIILFHVWPVSHSSGPVTFHGVYPNTGFNPLKSIFGWSEESWLSPKAAALATCLETFLFTECIASVMKTMRICLAGAGHTHIIDLLCPTVTVSFLLISTFIPVYHKFVLSLYIYL